MEIKPLDDSAVSKYHQGRFKNLIMKKTKNDYISYRLERAWKTFEDAKTQLSLHFVKTGKLDKDFGMLYGDLFDLRQKGDYGDFFDFEEKHVTALIPKVEEFLRKIESLTRE